MDYNSMEAGREMDCLIAELIFGRGRANARIDPMNRNGEPQYYWGYPLGHDFAPFYSTDIASAWLIVEQMKEQSSDVNGRFADFLDDATPREQELIYALTPLMICRAALNALGFPHGSVAWPVT